MLGTPRISLLVAQLAGLAAGTFADAGEDLRLGYRSSADGAPQFFRLYVPTGYDPRKPSPLVIARHGSGGNENSFFDDEAHYPAKHGLKYTAEQHRVLVACPSARGNTNYRGLGEISVFDVLHEVKRQYRLDDERIYLTGHSMGGTGATDLALGIADAMRAATGADVALYNHRKTDADRPIPAGTVDIVDLLQCSLPGDQDLVTVELSGRDVIEILDANIPSRNDPAGPAANLLVQLSGGSYTL